MQAQSLNHILITFWLPKTLWALQLLASSLAHTHSDHSPAVAALKSALPAAEVIGLVAPAGQDYEDLTFVPDVQPEDDQRFEHDGASVQAIHTPGHVANHICFFN